MILFIIFICIVIYTFSKYMETDNNLYLLLFLATIWVMFYFYWIVINDIIEQNQYLYNNNINF